MFRSVLFWVVILFIVAGVALTVVLGAFYWLLGAFLMAILLLVVVFLFAAYGVGRVEPSPGLRLQEAPHSERIPVIYDCDITMGHPFRSVDDGLALLYLLGEPRVDLLCVTTTYGNGPVRMTTRTARRLLDSLERTEVAVLRGAATPDEEAEANQAARYLRDVVSARPGEVVLIATGSMTNLKHAALLDPGFFGNLRGLYLTGGVTEPLFWNGRHLAEINFTLDPEAAYQAIHATCPVTITTGQAGLTAVFRGPQFAALQALGDPVSRIIARKIRFWFALMRLWFRDGGFAMLDSVAAVALTRPELLEFDRAHVASTRDDLRTGRLFVEISRRGPVRLVRGVRDYDDFILTHLAAWQRVGTGRNV